LVFGRFTWLWLLATGAVVVAYALAGPTRRTRRLFKPIYDKLAPLEAALWQKSRTMLFARLYQLAGLLVTVEAAMAESGIDWLPLVPIPQQDKIYVGPRLWLTGTLFAQLRKSTREPAAA